LLQKHKNNERFVNNGVTISKLLKLTFQPCWQRNMPILHTVLWPTPMKFPQCRYFEECTLVSRLEVIMY